MKYLKVLFKKIATAVSKKWNSINEQDPYYYVRLKELQEEREQQRLKYYRNWWGL